MQPFDSETALPPLPPAYWIERQLYASATSRVYRALRQQDQRPVVLKVLGSAHPQPAERARYQGEYAITRRLDAPGIIAAYGLETDRDTLVLVLEDCGGVSLDHWLEEGTSAAVFPLPEFLKLAGQIVAALAAIHAAGVIHKDLNPANIVVNPATGVVKVIDFGLATTLSRETPSLQTVQRLEGALAYLSPEQTGRMNRTVDYRTDFYSLGVTFYELLTGRLPFTAADPLELIHAHLAKPPIAPRLLNPAIPPVVSDLVLKLLAKAPEDRYQSARGVQRDLEACLRSWQCQGQIPAFALGQHDRAEHFLIPEKLYGRAREVEMLLAAFERVAHGHAELLLVTGFSGIGKTAVIHEVHKPITRQRGYFIKGKFDQFNRNVPFSGWVQAFRDLIGQLLSEGAAQRRQWQARLLAALGESGQVVIDVIPELEQLIGSQPPAPELSGAAAQNRFNLLFQKFIAIFATAEHPLVLFLDDLQWADLASLQLLQQLLSQSPMGYLLLLGAYRDNEVSPAHSLLMTLAELEKSGATLNTLTLAPLQQNDINQLIADSLGCAPELALPLTQLVYRLTQGNPFFNHQLLKALHNQGLIVFNDAQGRWQCDLAQVSALTLTDDIIAFMAMQLQNLPRGTQEVLQLAACIGNQFDLETLVIVRQQSPVETTADLWPAVQAGFVLPQSEVYPLPPGSGCDSDTNFLSSTYSPALTYHFLHDRVQQAAYSLIPEAQKQSTHLSIGQLLLRNALGARREEKIFEIVNQLNWGLELLIEPVERSELAQLNLSAGQKAKAATAHKAAWDYFTVGRQLLPEDCWKSQYELTLKLYEASVEAAYLNGDFESMERLAQVVMAKTKTILEKIRVYEIKSEALVAQNKFMEAVNNGLQILKFLGVQFPQEPSQDDIILALQEASLAYQKKSITELINLPLMSDPIQLATLRILLSIATAAYMAFPKLHTLLICKQMTLSIKYGNAPASTYGYACYGLILCAIVGEIEVGYQFGQLALDLLHRLNAKELRCRIEVLVYAFIKHWKESFSQQLIPLRSLYAIGLQTGDFQFASYAALTHSHFAYWLGIGKELSELQRETGSLSQAVHQMKQIMVFRHYRILQQAVNYLREGRTSSKYLQGEYYDEETLLPLQLQANDGTSIFYVHCHKLLLNYLFGDYQQAVENAVQAEKYSDAVIGFPYIPILYFYDSLARLAADGGSLNGESRKLLSSRITANQEKMKKWARSAPINYQHKFELVEAEWYRVLGDRTNAMDGYDRAIVGAKENGHLREAALANELAAQFYLDWGKEKVAEVYLREARDGYQRWGASAKVKQLEQRYARWLAPLDSPTHPTDLAAADSASLGATDRASGVSLDLLTVIKASQALAGEIELERLLRRMMRIVLENAGAQRGALLLEQGGAWVIEAQGDVGSKDIAVLQACDPKTNAAVSSAIVAHVARTRASVILDDAARSEEFGQDPYIVQERIKSVIGLPLVNQGRLSGILYLENNLATHAFTAERLELLRLLSTQMALSLDNAKLYRNLEAKVVERTHRLAEARDAADAASRAKSIFLANMSHELRTPLNAILGFSELMRRDALAGRSPLLATQREHLDVIHRSGEHLLALINDVLDLSKIEAGQATCHPGDCDLPELLQDVRDLFVPQAQDKRLSLQAQWAPEIPRCVRTDAAKLRQVLINLLGNAVKFTVEGGVLLDVTRVTELAAAVPRCRLRFTVADTGPGIDPAEQGRLFQVFTQTQTGLNAREGTGLGLAISRQFVRLLGGDLTVDSRPGHGSCFSFELDFDVIAVAEPPQARAGRAILGLAPHQPHYRVLVVDDQESNRRLLAQLLEPLSFAVQEATNGAAALRLWQEGQPDVLWLDLRMSGGLDGYEVARRIRTAEPTRRTKLLAISASAFDEERAQALAVGCDDFLRKPFRETELLEMMGRHLDLEFQYADAVPGTAAALPQEAIGHERLRALPEPLRYQLQDAVLQLDMQRTTTLAEQITEIDPALGAWIADQVRELRYEPVLHLLDSATVRTADPLP